jgi:membrane-bound lytic murein transglycosylase D
LPGETRNYVPAFIAVCYAMNYAEEHGIKPAKPRISLFETDTVQVKNQIDFEYLSQSIGITEGELEFLNPSYKINVIPKLDHRSYSLRLPKDKIGVFVQNETDIYAHFSKLDEQKKKSYPNYSEQNERVVHRVKPGEFLGRIAIRYGCSVKKIQQWNNLKSDQIKVGQKLVLYVRPDYI